MKMFLQICLFALMATTNSSWAGDVDALIQQLSGEDDPARSEARQLLPRESVDVVPKILPLLSNLEAKVWTAAFNTLADFANDVCVPGREQERETVTAHLMTLLAPSQPPDIKMRALQLLAIVVPEGYDVSPMAALLDDPELRERARAALHETNTAKSRAALARALRKADAAFQCALLDSLGQLQDPKHVATVIRYTKSDDAKVRAAAARAASWHANDATMAAIRTAYKNADATTAFDAADAVIRVADAAAMAGDRATATALYTEVLTTASDPASRGAVVVGLVRHGDETASETLVSTLRGEGGRELEPVVLSAFENTDGPQIKSLAHTVLPHLTPVGQAALRSGEAVP